MKIDSVLEKHQDRLLSTPGVVGVGIGGSEESPVIIVMVSHGRTQIAAKLPRTLSGYPVEVELTGEITAQNSL